MSMLRIQLFVVVVVVVVGGGGGGVMGRGRGRRRESQGGRESHNFTIFLWNENIFLLSLAAISLWQ